MYSILSTMIKTEPQKLEMFISHFWSYNISKITPEKTLDGICIFSAFIR
jgi:hypothetical protein